MASRNLPGLCLLKICLKKNLLRLAATHEKASEHPLADAIVSGTVERGIQPTSVGDFDSITGKGVPGVVENVKLMLGNTKLMDDAGVDFNELKEQAEAMRKECQTVMFVASEGQLAGILAVSDPIR